MYFEGPVVRGWREDMENRVPEASDTLIDICDESRNSVLKRVGVKESKDLTRRV